MAILNFGSDARLKMPCLSDDNVRISLWDETCQTIEQNNFACDFSHAEFDQTVSSYSLPIKWTQELTLYQIAFLAYEIKLEIIKQGAILNGIQVDDKKAIVSIQIPIAIAIVPLVEALNNVASKII